MTNFFDQAADRQLNGAQKAKERRQARTEERRLERATRMPSALEKKQAESAELAKRYRAWRRELKTRIVEQHGTDFKTLMRLLRNLAWCDAPRVVDFVRGARWLHRADPTDRLATLGYIDDALMRARIRDGRPPFDDGLMDEEPGPAVLIRRILFGH